jgi:hypothetical protein
VKALRLPYQGLALLHQPLDFVGRLLAKLVHARAIIPAQRTSEIEATNVERGQVE